MRRLIDADALIKYLDSCIDQSTGILKFTCEVIKCFVEQMRTVDAVEVVRCKDCMHMEHTPDGLRWCNVWGGINGMGDEGFCNYGERKDGDQS